MSGWNPVASHIAMGTKNTPYAVKVFTVTGGGIVLLQTLKMWLQSTEAKHKFCCIQFYFCKIIFVWLTIKSTKGFLTTQLEDETCDDGKDDGDDEDNEYDIFTNRHCRE